MSYDHTEGNLDHWTAQGDVEIPGDSTAMYPYM